MHSYCDGEIILSCIANCENKFDNAILPYTDAVKRRHIEVSHL